MKAEWRKIWIESIGFTEIFYSFHTDREIQLGDIFQVLSDEKFYDISVTQIVDGILAGKILGVNKELTALYLKNKTL